MSGYFICSQDMLDAAQDVLADNLLCLLGILGKRKLEQQLVVVNHRLSAGSRRACGIAGNGRRPKKE